MSEDSEYRRVAVRTCNATALLQAARHVSKAYSRTLSRVGLSATQYPILLLLSRKGSMSIPEIAEFLLVDRSNIGHALRPLERDGLITINASAGDRRRKIIALTDAGRTRMEDGRTAWGEAQTQFETLFGADEARAMRETMAAVAGLRFF